MNIRQAGRLRSLFVEATPPKPLYWEPGEAVPSVDISVTERDHEIELSLACYETTLVRFPCNLYVTDAGVLTEWDEDQDALVPVTTRWTYKPERYTWRMTCDQVEQGEPATTTEEASA